MAEALLDNHGRQFEPTVYKLRLITTLRFCLTATTFAPCYPRLYQASDKIEKPSID